LDCISAAEHVRVSAAAQSFRVQCPSNTITHPSNLHDNNSEPAVHWSTTLAANSSGFLAPSANVNGAIKCQQISGGDGYAAMGDGTQTYLFSFGPLSGITDIALGNPVPNLRNVFKRTRSRSRPATTWCP